MEPPRKTTYKQYLYGDFDRDKTKNIDDPMPFDPSVSQWPDAKKHPSFYHKAQYGGFETKMSTVLQNLENHNNSHSPGMKKILDENPGSYGRIKTIPSTIEKLAKYGLPETHDIAGVSIPTRNRQEVYHKAEHIKKKYNTNTSRTDDFYKNPKGGVYYAYHLEVLNPKPVEVQIASKKMRDLAVDTHEAYKYKKPMDSFIKRGKRLFDLGF